ncbi:MAG: hypothetical protein LBU11_08370 [Zoogloeaceae bacterium]|jgi:hypothetical protein|nr:hypothetical protein [Zoogloeaceae bacterium]
MNDLEKNLAKTVVPGSEGLPSHPGQPFIAAHYEKVFIGQKCRARSMGGGSGYDSPFVLPAGSSIEGSVSYQLDSMYTPVFTPDGRTILPGYEGSSGAVSWGCASVYADVWRPEQPYIAPTDGEPPTATGFENDFNPGWNSGARSLATFSRDGYARFRVPASVVGVVCGLNDANLSEDYAEIKHAFVFMNQEARVMEQGVPVGQPFAWNSADVFRVERRGGEVRYFQNDALRHVSEAYSAGRVFLDASLYMAGDRVEDPYMGVFSGMRDTPVAAIAGVAFEGEYRAALTGATLVLRVSAREFIENRARVATFAAQGYEGVSSVMIAPLAAIRSHAWENRPDMTPRYGVMAAAFAGLINGMTGTVRMTGRVSARGRPAVALAVAGMLSDRSVGNLSGTIGFIYGAGWERNPDFVLLADVLGVDAYMRVARQMFVVMDERARVLAAIQVDLLLDAALHNVLCLRDRLDYEAYFNAAIQEILRVEGVAGMDRAGGMEVWAFNMDNAASSSYENFPFNSFARFGGRCFGAKEDGVFLLEGRDDEHVPIAASIALGKQDFDSTRRKHIPSVYVGTDARERLLLKVSVDGESWIYAARASASEMRQQRIDLGRGLRANWFEFEILNEDGCEFALDTIEFLVAGDPRRI